MLEEVIRSTIEEGEAFGTAARILLPNGAAMQIADVSTWDVRVYDTSDPSQRIGYSELAIDPSLANTNPVPGSPLIISDTLRKDGYWPKTGSSPGYNFLHFITPTQWAAYTPTAFLPAGGHVYLVQRHFNLVGGWGVKVLKHYITVAPVTTYG